MATKENTNNTVEEATQENSKGGFFSFFSKNKETKVESISEIKIEQPTEANTEQTTEQTTDAKKTEAVTENVTIKVDTPTTSATPSTSKPVKLNEINIYDDEPSLRDIPLDIYDDSIKLEPQNPKYVTYHSIENNEIDSNLNNVNLYETTPETKKTIFRKIYEIFRETIRLIKAGINAIFAFIWLIIGGTITGIFVFFRKLWFKILRSFFKFMFSSNKNKDSDKKKGIVEGITDAKENMDMLWDINKMLVTTPVYQSV